MIGRKNVDMERPSAPGSRAANQPDTPERETTGSPGREEADSVESGESAAPRGSVEGQDRSDPRGSDDQGGI